jgi:hypothetical protein
MKKPVVRYVSYYFIIKSKAMKANIQQTNDPGNGGCCGGGLTDWGCC